MTKKQIIKIIEEYLKSTPFEISSIDHSIDEEEKMIWTSISTKDSRFLIGREGENLRALNYLLKRIIEQKTTEEDFVHVFIDINNYQKKKNDNIKTMAHMMAERARFFKNSVETEPMSPYERRIIHTYLQNKKDIKTESTGFGKGRRVVISFSENNESFTPERAEDSII